MTHTALPTGISSASPLGTKIFAKYPSSMLSISITALSVCTSAKISPTATASPSALFHRAIPPRVIVGDSDGNGITSCGGYDPDDANVRRIDANAGDIIARTSRRFACARPAADAPTTVVVVEKRDDADATFTACASADVDDADDDAPASPPARTTACAHDRAIARAYGVWRAMARCADGEECGARERSGA